MRELTLTAALLEPLLGAPHQPRLTFYDADEQRTELSTASLANWSAKVAGLLTHEVGAAPGDAVLVDLPPGWLHLPVLLGAWWAGTVVIADDDPDAAAAFVAPGSDARAAEVFVVSPHPLGLPATGVLPHQRDLGAAARLQADRYAAPLSAGGADALPGLPVVEIRRLLAESGVEPGARVLTTGPWTRPQTLLTQVLAPLAAGGSVVAIDGVTDAAAVDRIGRAERVTARR